MSILVTGATGFIGRRLVELLARRGESVHILCRPTANASFKENNIKIYLGDILDASSVARAAAGCDRVFHLAAYARNWAKDPRKFYEINVDGTQNVLDAAVKTSVIKVVLTSSAVTFGPSNGLAVDESVARRASFFTEYEHSKSLAEECVRHYVQKGLDVVIVNPTRVFGPGLLNESNAVTKMIHLYLQGKWRLILGDGRGIGNYAFVDDILQGYLLAMEAGRAGEKYILGGENASYNDLFAMVSDLSKRKYRVLHIPATLALFLANIEKLRAQWFHNYPLITPSWVKTFLADWAFSCARAQRELGYKITPLREALAITISWLEQQH
jgi:farnesol dehydrogenase